MSIAMWCILIAGLLPYLATLIAKGSMIGQYDNHHPREWLAKLSGMPARANAAQANSFEAFPFFAAAVIMATLQHGAQDKIDNLAMAFIAARLFYVVCYLADWAALRSVVWFVGMGCTVAIFVVSAG